jgi:membrane protein required for beta-lactamase induction
MTLLSIFLSLVLERMVGAVRSYRQFDWFDVWEAKVRGWCEARGIGGTLILLAVLVPPVLLVALVYLGLYDLLGGLLALAFNVVILVLCLGPQDLDEQVTAVLDAFDEGDEDVIRDASIALLGEEPPVNRLELQHRLVDTILLQANERIFSLVFSFVLLGPLGAVLYRLSCHLKGRQLGQDTEYAAKAARLHDLLAIIPAHLTALGYAMAGSFVDAVHAWRVKFEDWKSNWQASVIGAVTETGRGALRYEFSEEEGLDDAALHDQVKSTLGLVWRTLVIWVVLIAIFSLLGWST